MNMFKVDFEQFGYMFTFWTFTLCLAVIVWTPVEGQSEVIGSAQPIITSPGDDVILPCHLDPEFNVQGQTVEWSKPDLKPDPSDRLSRVEYVHLYRNRREVPDMKIPAYLSRTELFTDELERGNISLKIMNVTLADEGRYRCLVPKLKSRVKFAIVRLVIVEPNFDETWTTETPLHLQTPDLKDEMDVKGGCYSPRALISGVVIGCILLIFGGLVGGYLFKQRRQKPNHPKYDIVVSKSPSV
ncbi:butyrophilin subfamily 2 member A2-like [Thunnus thynnus]|uniref:butyrophilin subfamily 2 member A2-like n=1 Tax=Thunnus thynnus TaxID=8237 RepID=UPI00352986D6